MLAGALVAALDGLGVLFGSLYLEYWKSGHRKRVYVLEALLAATLGISVVLISSYGWRMVPWTVVGALAGRWAAYRIAD